MNNVKLSLGSIVCAATLSLASTAAATDIFSEHLDIDFDYSGGSGGILSLDLRTYSPMSAGVPTNNDDYSPAGNAIVIPLSQTYTVPSSAAWSCLGSSGSTVYRIRDTCASCGRVWLGMNTLDIPAATFVNNKIDFVIDSVVSAPAGARLVHYSVNSFGTPTFLLNTAGGVCNKQTYPSGVSHNIHSHGFWAVSAVGTYVIRFKATGTLVPALGGALKSSGTVDFTFKVQ